MVKTALVATEWATGLEIAKALDHSDLDIRVAMWLYPDEYDDWRFLLASPRLDAAKPAEAYGLVHDELTEAGIFLSVPRSL